MIKPNLNFNFPLLPSDWVYITEIFLYFINANGFWTIPHTHWCLIYIFAKHIHKKGTYNFAPNNFFIIARLTRTNTYIFGYFKGLTHALRLPNFSTLAFCAGPFILWKCLAFFVLNCQWNERWTVSVGHGNNSKRELPLKHAKNLRI